jgi:hypothetical protein
MTGLGRTFRHWTIERRIQDSSRIREGYSARRPRNLLLDPQDCWLTSGRLSPMQKSSGFRIGWAPFWKWRNSLGLADDMQRGFLHRPNSCHLGTMARWLVRPTLAQGPIASPLALA